MQKGTQIYITAGCFAYKNAPEKNNIGQINFELKECYTYSDMLAENLTTTSDYYLLSSAGMINFKAIANGEELELREGHELPINFNNTISNCEFDLYYGSTNENDEFNWSIDPLNCTPVPVIMASSGKNIKNENLFFNNLYTFSKEDKLALLNQSWQASVSFNERVDVIGSGMMDDKSKVLDKFNQIVKFYKNYVRNENFPSWEHLFSFSCISADSAAILKTQMENNTIRSMFDIENFVIPEKIFYSRRQGWLNCDKMLLLRPIVNAPVAIAASIRKIKELTKKYNNIIVSIDENANNTDVKLVYKHNKSIVSGRLIGNICTFNRVELGKEYVIVSTKCLEGKYYYSAKEAKSLDGNDIKINLAYNKYSTPEEVVAEYKKLDALLE